jgi:hypothetical protein
MRKGDHARNPLKITGIGAVRQSARLADLPSRRLGSPSKIRLLRLRRVILTARKHLLGFVAVLVTFGTFLYMLPVECNNIVTYGSANHTSILLCPWEKF